MRAREGRIEIRNLPRGAVRLGFTLSHPHFLPSPTLAWEIDLELERGSFDEVTPTIVAIGGAVRVTGDGTVARLAPFEKGALEVDVVGREAFFEALPAGVYEVTLCGDRECAEVIGRWEAEVGVGETVLVGEGPGVSP